MNKSFLTALGILLATSVFCLRSIYLMAKERAAAHSAEFNPTSMPTPTWSVPTETPIQTASPKVHILEQVRQLAAEYEQAVQSEKVNGEVEFSTDQNTGERLFHFQGESYQRISTLKRQLDEQILQLY